MTYKKIIWNAPERLRASKLKQMNDNYQAIRFLENRTPRGLINFSIVVEPGTASYTISPGSGDNTIHTINDQLMEAGRVYRIKVVNNNPIWNLTHTQLVQIKRDGTVVREKYIRGHTAGASSVPYSGQTWDQMYAVEYLFLCTTTATYDWTLVVNADSTDPWYWKASTAVVNVDAEFTAVQKGTHYLVIEDIGVIDP